jgi:GNAT superfamily N-acetyltransferase
MTDPQFHYRMARKGEGQRLLEIQIAALQKNSQLFYSKHAIESWISALDYNDYEQAIIGGEVYVSTSEKSIVGFGQYKTEWREIKELYVDPSVEKKGIGRSIVGYLECLARSLNVDTLRTFATLNAEPFYKRLGFKVIGHKQLEVANNTFVAFVEMDKSIIS